MRTALTNVALLCIISVISARAQVLCEQVPEFAVPQMLAQECRDTSEVFGSILGADLSMGAVHISLSGLSFNKFLEIDTDALGSFSLHSVSAGDYELLATQRGRILGLAWVNVRPVMSQLILQLPARLQLPLEPFPFPILSGPYCVRSKCIVLDGSVPRQ